MENPTIRGISNVICSILGHTGEKRVRAGSMTQIIDLQAEADALDVSIYPAPTRKAEGLSRFRRSAHLLQPRCILLTGTTGYLGAFLLAEALLVAPGEVRVICLVRAADKDAARRRIFDTLDKYDQLGRLLEAYAGVEGDVANPMDVVVQETKDSGNGEASSSSASSYDKAVGVLGEWVEPICGDLGKPLLGMDQDVFKACAGEADSIIHCGADVNLVKPYDSLKKTNVRVKIQIQMIRGVELGTLHILYFMHHQTQLTQFIERALCALLSPLVTSISSVTSLSSLLSLLFLQVLGTQEILRLAVTNGFHTTKVKPVYFISTNGIFPTTSGEEEGEGKGDGGLYHCDENTDVTSQEMWSRLGDGYSQSKWVAEEMCRAARSRGLPISIMRPGNMAGCSVTGAWNEHDFVKLLVQVRRLHLSPITPCRFGCVLC